MPILSVEIVLRPDEAIPDHLAQSIADQAGRVFGSPPGTTWVKLYPVHHYAENASNEAFYPVFVSVLKAVLPAGDELQAEIRQLTFALAETCGRPSDSVHVLYLPSAAGRIAFGGSLRR